VSIFFILCNDKILVFRKIGKFTDSHTFYNCKPITLPDFRDKAVQIVEFTGGYDENRAIRHVSDISCDVMPFGAVPHKPAETHSLNPAAHYDFASRHSSTSCINARFIPSQISRRLSRINAANGCQTAKYENYKELCFILHSVIKYQRVDICQVCLCTEQDKHCRFLPPDVTNPCLPSDTGGIVGFAHALFPYRSRIKQARIKKGIISANAGNEKKRRLAPAFHYLSLVYQLLAIT
jgi:hypothetical protein